MVRLPQTHTPLWNSIGVKILGAFIAMGLVTAILGGYSIYVLRASGAIIAQTYDGPLMEINFARAASLGFTRMDKQALRWQLATEAERPDVDRKIDELSTAFFEDLSVAETRALGERERKIIQRIRTAVMNWQDLRRGPTNPEREAQRETVTNGIIDDFDTLIELTADQSFVQRRKAITATANFRYASVVLAAAALLAGLTVSLLLARGIAKPLTAAAKVADRIADGELQTPIPQGGRDETGMLLRSMTVMQDNIREMMAREVAQRQSAQSRLIDALESSSEGMILVDADRKIVIANSQVADFFPAIAPSMVGGTDFDTVFSQIQLSWRGDGARGRNELHGQDGLPFSVSEYQLLDGRWLRVSRDPTRDGGFFLFLIDFTEVKEREERLKEATRLADAANTAKSHFLANMSHELRTPLNAIIGFSEMISGQMFGPVGNAYYVEYADNILESGRHLLGIINSVLDLAKNESGKLELRPEAFDLEEIVQGCTVMMRESCARADLTLHTTLPEYPLPVYGEPAKLKQIILNLLSNAIKFNRPSGSVSLLARRGETGMTEFQVIDTGIGMSASDIAIALTPFGQVDSSLARRYEGTGLGLPLTKALVELHGGTMTIDSEPGRGTTVTVAMPAAA